MFRHLYAAPLALLLCAAPAAAETTLCTPITSIPTDISTPGSYCLTGNLQTELDLGSAIRLDANNITLDCNGHWLEGPAGGATDRVFGVTSWGRSNITVRNCNLRGFWGGINLQMGEIDPGQGTRGTGAVVEDNRVEGSTLIGIAVRMPAGVVRRNIVVDTGPWSNWSAYGILLDFGSDAIDNTIDGVAANQYTDTFAVGIHAAGDHAGAGSAIVGNRIRGIVSERAAHGIMATWGRNVIQGNTLHATPSPAAVEAVKCDYPGTLLAGNTSGGFLSLASTGCTLGDGNVHQPAQE